MTERTMDDTTLVLQRTFKAPRTRVFDAFVDPAMLRRWYAPVAGWEVSVAEVDLRVGGQYLMHFGPPGGDPIVERGEYREIVPNERLVYATGITNTSGSMNENTIVTVTFRDVEGGCEVLVVEEGYSTPEVRDRHLGGWTRMFEQLGAALA